MKMIVNKREMRDLEVVQVGRGDIDAVMDMLLRRPVALVVAHRVHRHAVRRTTITLRGGVLSTRYRAGAGQWVGLSPATTDSPSSAVLGLSYTRSSPRVSQTTIDIEGEGELNRCTTAAHTGRTAVIP